MSAAAKASYKARKEAFVSNLSGSSLADINLVTLVAPVALLLWAALQKKQSFFTPNDAVALIVDYLLNVGAILFAFTIYSSAPILLNVLLAVPAIILLLPLLPSPKAVRKASGTRSVAKKIKLSGVQNSIPSRPFITNYRGAMMIVTCIAILAVDFPVFPRRFAKVETWGTSLMDIGVGSFVFSAGVVSARQVLKTPAASEPRRSLPGRLVRSSRHSVPLLILGLIRLYTVKGLDYAEHVTEYGVHWNFFFTLALLPPFVELADVAIRLTFKSYDLLAILIAVVYQIVLNNTTLLSYILISPRGPSLMSKNREGIFSFIGYLAIFLGGRGTGMQILPIQNAASMLKAPSADPVVLTARERQAVLINLFKQAGIYVTLFVLATTYYTFNLNVSRRLANAPYILWIAAFNNVQLLLFGAVEHIGPRFAFPQIGSIGSAVSSSSSSSSSSPSSLQRQTDATVNPTDPVNATSKVMQAYNKSGLAIFLIANLLTGLVNLTFNTLDTTNTTAMGILIAYTSFLTMLALYLDHTGIRLRL